VFGKTILEVIRIMDRTNIGKIESLIRMSQVFEQDGIHFMGSLGRVYINALLYNMNWLFKSDEFDLKAQTQLMETANQKDKVKPERITKRIPVVKSEIANMQDSITRCRKDDSLVTTCIWEELHFFTNVEK
jgi:hypothetical protein